MRPRVLDTAGRELAPALTVLLIPKEPEESTAFFRFQVMKTQDPRDVYERALVYLQADYFQSPKTFSDRLVVVLPRRLLARRIADRHGDCILEFEPVPAALLHPLQGARTQARQRRPRSGDLAQPGVQSRTARRGEGHCLQTRLGIGRGLRVCRSQGWALARPCAPVQTAHRPICLIWRISPIRLKPVIALPRYLTEEPIDRSGARTKRG